jgi:hypothetical protein
MKVAGRKVIVRTAMVFIAELSLLVALAIAFESLARSILTRASF